MDLGIEVEIIDQVEGLPDMVIASDQGIGVGEKWLLSNFWYSERRGESAVYEKWYQDQGYDVIKLPSEINFEDGGETVRWGDYVFVGSGFRFSVGVGSFIRESLDSEVWSK